MKRDLQIFIFHIIRLYLLPRTRNAQMAKLVDALCSGRSVRKDVLVRIQFWALQKKVLQFAGLFHLQSHPRQCVIHFFMD